LRLLRWTQGFRSRVGHTTHPAGKWKRAENVGTTICRPVSSALVVPDVFGRLNKSSSRVIAYAEAGQWPGGPAEISRWREPPVPQQNRVRPGGCAGSLAVSAATSGADSVFGSDPVARATG
jgi:hypothetical protein